MKRIVAVRVVCRLGLRGCTVGDDRLRLIDSFNTASKGGRYGAN